MVKKYDLCIKLKINGEEKEQLLVTASLEAIEKYTSYCESFSAIGVKYNRSDFIYYLGASHGRVSKFLDEYKASDQPLFIKCDGKYTDIPVLYSSDLDVLLIGDEELSKLLGVSINEIGSLENKIIKGIKLKKANGGNLASLVDLNSKVTDPSDGSSISLKDIKLRDLNKKLNKYNENYDYIHRQIEENLRDIISEMERVEKDNNKSFAKETVVSEVGFSKKNEQTEWTDEDTLKYYEEQYIKIPVTENKTKLELKERIRILKLIIYYTKERDEYLKGIKSLIPSSTIDYDKSLENLNLKISELQCRMSDLDSGDLFFSDAGILVRKEDMDDNMNM